MIRSVRVLRTLATVLLVASGLASCSTVESPTAPPAAGTSAELRLDLLSGLLACRPQPYARQVQVVGPTGGTIRVGGHTLVIPRGALSGSVTITAEAPSDLVASVRFQPEGLRFQRPATLTLDYSSCPLGRLQILKRVAYTTEDLNILSFLLSRDDLLQMRVSADLQHFSRYAVAW